MMEEGRRRFLKAGGLSILGLSALPLLSPLARGVEPKYQSNPKALKASQWAMVIDMKKCWEQQKKEPCRACIEVCHKIHNVPSIPDPKREVKWIWLEEYEHAFPDQAHEYAPDVLEDKLFLVLCNHCTHPPCVRVCPTKATFKRSQDGIVMMDFHRCIGCRYCMAACPFGSRSFNWGDPRPYIKEINPEFPTRTRGVVEKCDFCAERIDVGKIPACVEACKAKALVFGDLGDPNSEVRRLLETNFTVRRKNELGTGPNIYYIV